MRKVYELRLRRLYKESECELHAPRGKNFVPQFFRSKDQTTTSFRLKVLEMILCSTRVTIVCSFFGRVVVDPVCGGVLHAYPKVGASWTCTGSIIISLHVSSELAACVLVPTWAQKQNPM